VKVEVGKVYKNTNETMVLLVVSTSTVSARCVVIWKNDELGNAYRVGEIDSWAKGLIEEHWKPVC
jgi:hypothetical protein